MASGAPGGLSFESLREVLDALPMPAQSGDRNTYWVFPRLLGIAKSSGAVFEIFLVGPQLRPHTATVRRHLEFGAWLVTTNGSTMDANRVVLPNAPHFVAIAALIAIELVRAGLNAGRSLQDAFNDIEPILELALRRGALTEDHVVGLVGELLVVEEMLDMVAQRPELRQAVLDTWHGHSIGRRDFSLASAGIEVKTTQQESSSHKISGLHQIEVDSSDGVGEREVFLLSVGLAATEHEGRTLPELVSGIFDRLADPAIKTSPLQSRFLDDVARYGASSGRGYDHRTMSAWPVYQVRYHLTFTPRLYDMSDPDVRVVRRRDLAGTHVDADDVQYRLELPATINAVNPASSWQRTLARLVRTALSIDSGIEA